MGGGIKKSIRYYHIKVCHNLNEIPLPYRCGSRICGSRGTAQQISGDANELGPRGPGARAAR